MKTYKLFSIFLLYIGFCTITNAQTTYKGITIDRGNPDVDCIYVTNTNSYPCSISLQYKTNSKDAPWRSYSFYDNIPENVKNYKIGSVGSKIFGLKLVSVDILQPTVIDKVMTFVTGEDYSNQNSSDRGRMKIADGLYLVNYGKEVIIEDDINKRSISITISQENIDYQTGKKIYTVACSGWTKQVFKEGLKLAIEYGIRTYGGTKNIADYAGKLSGIAYDAVCDYYGDTYGN